MTRRNRHRVDFPTQGKYTGSLLAPTCLRVTSAVPAGCAKGSSSILIKCRRTRTRSSKQHHGAASDDRTVWQRPRSAQEGFRDLPTRLLLSISSRSIEDSHMNHRSNSSRRAGGRSGVSIPGLNVDIEMLVQSTQGSAMHFGRKTAGEKFHGWLWKKSGRFSKWRNQHFVLDGALLTYYDTFPTDQFVSESSLMPIQGDNLFTTKSESTPAGAVRVAHVETSQKSKIAFKVYAVSGKIIDVRAKNETLCRQWVDRLNEAAALAKRQESLNTSTTSTASSTLSVGYSDSELDAQCNIVDKSGWLEVGDRKSKRARFCVMQGNMFTVYDTEDAWAVPLSRAYVTHAEKISEATCEFSVSTCAGKVTKTLMCKARSQDEMHLWMEALSNAFE
ncbi:hypothetical protein PC114_g21629 [Phytophthora cactorum]|uniref:PH domain-containing protein n=1 Tax=Phytophthora cactorum TaxID=29920 RepID=A0A8T1B133_9STRA|nr:hypothetical protein PC114_g21629 [Phytophthora cactorum]KAG2891240.1 hypothetical protein PC115_g19265 [Phytophthora cactorum]KAG3061033.1 hypothetical protein PC122_g19788 [Phytophthora cactorum]